MKRADAAGRAGVALPPASPGEGASHGDPDRSASPTNGTDGTDGTDGMDGMVDVDVPAELDQLWTRADFEALERALGRFD